MFWLIAAKRQLKCPLTCLKINKATPLRNADLSCTLPERVDGISLLPNVLKHFFKGAFYLCKGLAILKEFWGGVGGLHVSKNNWSTFKGFIKLITPQKNTYLGNLSRARRSQESTNSTFRAFPAAHIWDAFLTGWLPVRGLWILQGELN